MNKILSLVLLVGLLVSGCTLNFDEKIANVEKRIEAAEGRLDSLESRVDTIEQRLAIVEEGCAKYKTEAGGKVASIDMTNEEVQTALKNAGFYTGAIDGKMGPNSDKAIKDFQVANGLKADGVVGSKTKALLAKYLTQQPKTE